MAQRDTISKADRRRRVLEVCIDELASARAAIGGGADRLELCSALALGGLTPSPAFTRRVVALARPGGVAVRAIVRARAGNFTFDDDLLALAIDEARDLIAAGADGLVFGATKHGSLDWDVLERWTGAVRASAPDIGLTLHRAIDAVADPVAAVAAARDLGFDRILTSGGAMTAADGAKVIARMVAAAGDGPTIMAGSGVRPENVAALIETTGVSEVHASASAFVAEPDARLSALGFDMPPRRSTDAETVARLRTIIDRIPQATFNGAELDE